MTELIEILLEGLGLSLNDPVKLAKAVKDLSDHYTSELNQETPWSQKNFQVAYTTYFWPLNYLRLKSVFDEAKKREFLSGTHTVIDFGSGMGTAQWLLEQQSSIARYICIEPAKEARSLHQQMLQAMKEVGQVPRLEPEWISEKELSKELLEQSLVLCSYSLNELAEAPKWLNQAGKLMVLEPSTHQAGRKLLELRQSLLAQGYQAWAPCTHQRPCPLLVHSQKDWCHNRVFIDMPPWYRAMEDHLPMTNRSLTLSYLLMAKNEPPALSANIARVIGDTMKEKGKTRQLMCRGPEREFLAWMKKDKVVQEIARGSLIELPHSLVKKSNEIRLTEPVPTLDDPDI